MTTVFENIFHGLGTEIGEFRIIAAGVGWKSASGAKVTFMSQEIKYIQWLRVARNFQLRFIFNANRPRETFDGFLREDHDKIAHLVKQHWNIALETKEMSFKGWNWGAFDVQGSDLAFLVSNRTVFEVPLEKIANSNMAGKNEVSLEFALSQPPPSGKKSREDELMEIRLFIPNGYARETGEGSDKAGAEKMDVDDDADVNAAQTFHDMIKEKAEIGQFTGERIALFEDINITTPRGRFDIDMFKDFFRLRGKMYDYKIFYTAITRLFLLPKPDDVHIAFVIGLDPPIRQGQTRHQYLVMQTSRDDEAEMELQLDEEEIEKNYAGKLQKKYDQPMHEVLSTVFRGLGDRKITAPSMNFTSRDGHSSIRTSLKAAQGDLYFLEKGVIFLGKPVTHIEYNAISNVVFSRVGGAMTSARTFDLKFQVGSTETTFSSINKEEQEIVETFVKSKKLRVKNEINDEMLMGAAIPQLDDDSDEDMSDPSDDDDDDDRGKGKGKSKSASKSKSSSKPAAPMDLDSEEDEDFQASSSDEGSPSESESDDSDGAATASDASGDADIVKKPKKKKAAAAASGADGETPKKKKVKKAAVDDGNDRPKKKVKTKKDD